VLLKFVLLMIAPLKFAFLRLVRLRSVLRRVAPLRFAFLRLVL